MPITMIDKTTVFSVSEATIDSSSNEPLHRFLHELVIMVILKFLISISYDMSVLL